MAIDSQAKRMSCVAVSHYALSASVLADGTIGAEDRAAAGFGYFYDISGAPAGPAAGLRTLALTGAGI